MLRAAVFCNNGLGDGLIGLVLSNNLHLNGWQVTTFNNGIGSLQNWVPHLPITSYSSIECIENLFRLYDWLFVFQNSQCDLIQKIIKEGKLRRPEQTKVIYAYPSKNIVQEPYYFDSQIDPTRPLGENLRLFCENILHLPRSAKNNGLISPSDLKYRKHDRRILIHPTSSRAGKNWPKEKYIQTAIELQKQGYLIAWVMSADEREEWKEIESVVGILPQFSSLDELASFCYESGFFIGNDSGIGHLASYLEIPTMTIVRSRRLANLWAPSYSPGIVVAPSSFIPNFRGLRLRDQKWQTFVTVNHVMRSFRRLVRLTRLQTSIATH